MYAQIVVLVKEGKYSTLDVTCRLISTPTGINRPPMRLAIFKAQTWYKFRARLLSFKRWVYRCYGMKITHFTRTGSPETGLTSGNFPTTGFVKSKLPSLILHAVKLC